MSLAPPPQPLARQGVTGTLTAHRQRGKKSVNDGEWSTK